LWDGRYISSSEDYLDLQNLAAPVLHGFSSASGSRNFQTPQQQEFVVPSNRSTSELDIFSAAPLHGSRASSYMPAERRMGAETPC
jgi:hypothetical protein